MFRYHLPILIPAAIWHLRDVLARLAGRARFKFLCFLWGVEHGARGEFTGPTIIRTLRKGQIKLGDRIVFVSRVTQNVVGLTQPTIIDTRWGGSIRIGSFCGFSSVVISSKTAVEIGERVIAGGNVRIFDHDFHSIRYNYRNTPDDVKNVKSKRVHIEDDVWIGMNAIILKGTHIGARSVISAGSVIYGLDVPPDSLVKGNPAVVVRRLKKSGDAHEKSLC